MAVTKKDAYYISSTLVNQIHCSIWQDDEQIPIGILQIAHGVSEYIDRYDEFASYMAKRGFIVCGNDHLGHGLSVSDPQDFGFFADENGDKRMVDDMHILSLIMKKHYPDLPLFLFGHSMGSFCARVYAADFGDEINGLILCGTGELPASAVVLEQPLAFLCSKLGARAVPPLSLLDKLSTLGIKDRQTDKDWLSRNKENVERYINDPLCGQPLKLGGIRDIISLANSACATDWAYKVPLGLPILIISGAKDPVGLNGKGVIACSDNLESASHEPNVILYPGDRHEILNEDDREKVFSDVYSFLCEALAKIAS